MPPMEPEELQRRLYDGGVSRPHVLRRTRADHELVVYVEQNDGRLNQQEALRLLHAMPEVAGVRTTSCFTTKMFSPVPSAT